ncbi:MAG: GNAT family N-acetyltransferase [Thermoclostridium sp.]|nr:GNAT family N-acetyltransferase [Thermoclostridium sp.]
MEIKEYRNFNHVEIVNLYKSVGWMNYVKLQDMLKKAYENSLCVLAAYKDDKLVGIIRAVGDGVSIVFIQDIIVLPQYQRQGIGTMLLKAIMEKYQSVYQMELFTDNTEKTVSFYKSVGFKPANEIGCLSFIRM